MHTQTFPTIPFPSLPLSIEVEYKAKSSFPTVPSASKEGAVGPQILAPIYSQEQHETWQQLFKKQARLASEKPSLCEEYMTGLSLLKFSQDAVPSLAEISDQLYKATGWQVVRVDGMVPADKFFALLANKLFPCTDFIRHQDELDYTPAPDTFHDQVGHLPMITHPRFAHFFYLFGLAGCRVKNEEQLMWFNRIYWFTVEFGLINHTAHHGAHRDPSQALIYGAGIASSCGEIVYSLSEKVEKLPFSLDVITSTEFDIHNMQNKLFEIESFDELEQKFTAWAIKHAFL